MTEELQRARERGMLEYKAFVFKLIDDYCDKVAESAALKLGDYRQGQVKTAENLREHLKEYLK